MRGMMNGAPSSAVTMPTGISCGARIMRETTSAQRENGTQNSRNGQRPAMAGTHQAPRDVRDDQTDEADGSGHRHHHADQQAAQAQQDSPQDVGVDADGQGDGVAGRQGIDARGQEDEERGNHRGDDEGDQQGAIEGRKAEGAEEPEHDRAAGLGGIRGEDEETGGGGQGVADGHAGQQDAQGRQASGGHRHAEDNRGGCERAEKCGALEGIIAELRADAQHDRGCGTTAGAGMNAKNIRVCQQVSHHRLQHHARDGQGCANGGGQDHAGSAQLPDNGIRGAIRGPGRGVCGCSAGEGLGEVMAEHAEGLGNGDAGGAQADTRDDAGSRCDQQRDEPGEGTGWACGHGVSVTTF